MKALSSMIAGLTLAAISITAANAAEKHLFYSNGCCVEKYNVGGNDATIAKALRNSGFNLVFQSRTDDSDASIRSEVEKIADQVKSMLSNGIAPEDITVSGYSLGSAITLFASIAIANPKVNYVLLAGCPGSGARSFGIDYAKVQGRILSIIDTQDDRFGTCKNLLPESVLQNEIAFTSGYGHAAFRKTDSENMKRWKEPLENWSKVKLAE
jgi:hypothetical protein